MNTNEFGVVFPPACWKDRRSWIEEEHGLGPPEWRAAQAVGGNATCLLPDGHEGPHEWTPDDQIEVSFPLAIPPAEGPSAN